MHRESLRIRRVTFQSGGAPIFKRTAGNRRPQLSPYPANSRGKGAITVGPPRHTSLSYPAWGRASEGSLRPRPLKAPATSWRQGIFDQLKLLTERGKQNGSSTGRKYKMSAAVMARLKLTSPS